MKSAMPPQSTPFDPVTGDVLPEFRDAYLLGQLAPPVAQAVEEHVKTSAIQTGVILGRYHELSAEARAQGRTLVAPSWVQQQLQFQVSTSKAGPLRRPAVRLVGGLFLLLCLASVVQWIRNEPLVPAPVAAAVTRVAASATRATRQLVRQLTQPEAPVVAKAASTAPSPTRVRPARKAPARPLPVMQELPARPAAIAALSADTVSHALPAVLPPSAGGQVRGQITDEDGSPLVGATVLVQGTRVATSTDASGHYVLEVPAGATLLFGYGGYLDQTLRPTGPGTLNVVLLPGTRVRIARRR